MSSSSSSTGNSLEKWMYIDQSGEFNNITMVRSMLLLTSNLFAVGQHRNLIPFHSQKSLEWVNKHFNVGWETYFLSLTFTTLGRLDVLESSSSEDECFRFLVEPLDDKPTVFTTLLPTFGSGRQNRFIHVNMKMKNTQNHRDQKLMLQSTVA